LLRTGYRRHGVHSSSPDARVRDAVAARAEELADKILAAHEAWPRRTRPPVRFRSADSSGAASTANPKNRSKPLEISPEVQEIRDMKLL